MITWIYSEGDISTLKSNSSFMSCVKVFHVTILQKCGFSLCTQFNIVCLDQNVTRKHALDWIMWHLGTLSINRFRDTSEDKVKVSLLLSATPSAQIWNSLIPYVQGAFLTVPPNFQYQNEKWWAANQRFFSMKFSMYKRSSLVEQRFFLLALEFGRNS